MKIVFSVLLILIVFVGHAYGQFEQRSNIFFAAGTSLVSTSLPSIDEGVLPIEAISGRNFGAVLGVGMRHKIFKDSSAIAFSLSGAATYHEDVFTDPFTKSLTTATVSQVRLGISPSLQVVESNWTFLVGFNISTKIASWEKFAAGNNESQIGGIDLKAYQHRALNFGPSFEVGHLFSNILVSVFFEPLIRPVYESSVIVQTDNGEGVALNGVMRSLAMRFSVPLGLDRE